MQFAQLKRRDFITLIAGAAATWPLAASAQPGERMRRIGVLMPIAADDPDVPARLVAFQKGLQELGWVDGHDVQIYYRWAQGDTASIRTEAAELVSLTPDMIVASSTPVVVALRAETSTAERK